MRFCPLRVSQLLIPLASLLSSCAAAAPRPVAFDETELAPYRGAGTGTVSGQFVVAAEGEVHIGNNEQVTLLPVTSYTKEMVEREIVKGENLAASDPRFQPYVHLAKTDDQGNFIFEHIRPGEYFLSGLVEWYFGDDVRYQWACERISIGAGQKLRVSPSWFSEPLNRVS